MYTGSHEYIIDALKQSRKIVIRWHSGVHPMKVLIYIPPKVGRILLRYIPHYDFNFMVQFYYA
jgi:hypothetical protein